MVNVLHNELMIDTCVDKFGLIKNAYVKIKVYEFDIHKNRNRLVSKFKAS